MDEETEEYENHEEGKGSISADLIRGHINTIILRSLYDRDKYGYEIINEINEKSHGQYTLKQPTLYSALKRLETQGYIQAYWKTDEVSSGGRRKYFRLTDSGKEMTEKNQAEWEYSRTVIDNLISDKNFDFSQPAPTPVDFRLLRQSTSRVPTGQGKSEGENEADEDDANPEQQPVVQVLAEPIIEAVTFTSLHETSVILQPDEIAEDQLPSEEKEENKEEKAAESTEGEEIITEESVVTDIQELAQETESAENVDTAAEDNQQKNITEPVQEEPEEQPSEDLTSAQQSAATSQITVEQQEDAVPSEQPVAPQLQQAYDAGDLAELAAAEDQRRISHEIYEKLVSGEFEKKAEPVEPETPPVQEEVHTDEYLYANRPEAERDYRNLVDKIFAQTVNRPVMAQEQPINEEPPVTIQQQPVQEQVQSQQPPIQIINQPAPQPIQRQNYFDASSKAANDGIKIHTSENQTYSVKATHTTYNRGATLFKCSLIVGVIILLEFTLCLLFKDMLEISSFVYPFVILTLGLADILVCGILYGAGYGKQVRKPTNQKYIITSIIMTVIIMLIILVFAFLLSVNWSVTTDVLVKVVIPCIVALNIPIFTLSFYLLTK